MSDKNDVDKNQMTESKKEDKILPRTLKLEPFVFTPKFKCIFVSNDMPYIIKDWKD